MKIGEVKVGEEYGALDYVRRNRGHRADIKSLRRVEVIEIVTQEESRYSSYAFGSPKKINVKRVKVKVLGPATRSGSWSDRIAGAEEGRTLVIEARQLVVLWSEVSGDVAKAHAEETAAAQEQDELEKRLRKLVGRDTSGGYFYVSVTPGRRWPSEARITGSKLLKLIELAEKGKAAAS